MCLSCRLLESFFVISIHFDHQISSHQQLAVPCFSGKLGVKVRAGSSCCSAFSWDRVVFSFIVAGVMISFGLDRKKNVDNTEIF